MIVRLGEFGDKRMPSLRNHALLASLSVGTLILNSGGDMRLYLKLSLLSCFFRCPAAKHLHVVALTIAVIMLGTQQASAQCVTEQPFYGSVEIAYEPKGNFNNKPKAEDITAAETQAVQSAWQNYVGSCMGAGQMQQYIAQQNDILRNLDSYLVKKQVAHSFDKKSKTITAEALLIVNQPLIEGMFTSTSGGGDGDGAYMVWIFAAKQAGYTKESDVTTYDADRSKQSSAKSLNSQETVFAEDDTTTVESTFTETNSKSSSGGQTTQRGAERTGVIREFELVSTGEFNTQFSEIMSLNYFEPTEYLDVLDACGGEDLEVIEEELAFDGRMSRETRRAVITGLRDCDVKYLAIGNIEINQPKVSAVEGYNVTVKVIGEVLDVSRRLPKKVAAIGPVLGQAGGDEDNIAVANAMKNAGKIAAEEIVSRLNAKGVN